MKTLIHEGARVAFAMLAPAFALLLISVALAHAQNRPGHWQLPDYGRSHGVVTEPEMPKCNMAVSEECRRLYGRSAANVQRSSSGSRYFDCLRDRAKSMVLRGDPRALRAAETVRARGNAVGTPDFDAIHAENVRACRGRK
jgi:hypothetical protein